MTIKTQRHNIQPMLFIITLVVMVVGGWLTARTYLSRSGRKIANSNSLVYSPSRPVFPHIGRNLKILFSMGIYPDLALFTLAILAKPGLDFSFVFNSVFSIIGAFFSLVILMICLLLLNQFLSICLIVFSHLLSLLFAPAVVVVTMATFAMSEQAILTPTILIKLVKRFQFLAFGTAFHFTPKNGDPHRLAVLLSRQHPINLWGPRKIKNPPVGLSCLDTNIIARFGEFYHI